MLSKLVTRGVLHASSFKSAPHGLNGYFHSTVCVHDRTGRADGMHWTPQGQRPVDSSKVPEGKRAPDTSARGRSDAPQCPVITRPYHALTSFAPDANALCPVPCVRCHAKMHRTRCGLSPLAQLLRVCLCLN
jgi:hypothetical protein